MTKEEFISSPDPLVLIISFDPKTKETITNTYPYKEEKFWLDFYNRSFPTQFHVSILNNSTKEALKAMKLYFKREVLTEIDSDF